MNPVTKKESWLFCCLVIVFAWHTIIPVVGLYTPAALNFAILLFLLLYLINHSNGTFGSMVKAVVPLYLLSFIGILQEPMSNLLINIYAVVQRIILPIVALYIMKCNNQYRVKNIWFFIVFGLLVTCITTYYGCLNYPGAAREQAAALAETNSELFQLYRSMNIGSFNFVYMVVLMLPLLLYIIRNRCKHYWFYLLVLFGCILTIIITEYTTALLLSICCLFLVFLPKNFAASDLRKYGFVLIISSFIIWQIIPYVLEMLLPYIESESVSSRLSDLMSTLQGGSSYSEDNDLESRQDFYMKSVDGFLSSPLWGSNSVGGGHSFVLDTLCRYGLIGLGLMYYMLRQIFNLFIKPYKHQPFFGFILFAYGLALIMMILNPKDNLFFLVFILPLFAQTYSITDK